MLSAVVCIYNLCMYDISKCIQISINVVHLVGIVSVKSGYKLLHKSFFRV